MVEATIQWLLFSQCMICTVHSPLRPFTVFCCNNAHRRPPASGNCFLSRYWTIYMCLSVTCSPCSIFVLSVAVKVNNPCVLSFSQTNSANCLCQHFINRRVTEYGFYSHVGSSCVIVETSCLVIEASCLVV